MAFTTPAMGLIVWNQPTDPYDSTQLAGNFAKLDEHDHTPGKGLPITTGAIADGAITTTKLDAGFTLPSGSVTNAQLAADSVTTGNVLDGSLIPDDFSSTLVNDLIGLNSSGVIRRGKSIIATPQSISSTSYTLLATPDVVSNIVLPTDGLILVAYQATWQQSVNAAGRAAIFLGASQVQMAGPTGPVTSAAVAQGALTTGTDLVLCSTWAGLASPSVGGYSGDVTTGQIIGMAASGGGAADQPTIDFGGTIYAVPAAGAAGVAPAVGGLCHIFAAAGTYDISVQFKASSGSVTAKNRNLWVWTIGF